MPAKVNIIDYCSDHAAERFEQLYHPTKKRPVRLKKPHRSTTYTPTPISELPTYSYSPLMVSPIVYGLTSGPSPSLK